AAVGRGRVPLVVVEVAPDRGHVVVLGVADDVVDGEVAAGNETRLALVVHVEGLAREQDLRLRPPGRLAQPVALLAVEVAEDAGVDADEPHRSRLQGPVRAGKRRRLPKRGPQLPAAAERVLRADAGLAPQPPAQPRLEAGTADLSR